MRRDVNRKGRVKWGCLFLVVTLSGVCSTMSLAQGEKGKRRVVATVQKDNDLIEITATRLLAYAKTRPAVPLKQLIRELVEFEFLVREAEKVGLQDEPTVLLERDRVMVRRLLKKEFESEWRAESLPKKFVEMSYNQNKGTFNHPELRDAVHIVLTLGGKRSTDPDVDALSRQLAEKIYQDMSSNPPADLESFLARSQNYQADAKRIGIQVDGQRLSRFARTGSYAPDFTDRVFAHRKPRSVLPPFVTQFGYHVVWLEKAIPAKAQPVEEVAAELRIRILPEVRRMQWRKMTDKLALQYAPISKMFGARRLMNPQPLELLEVSRGKAVK
jgi:parvulin-like peptidyl-prolyl isomerase